jgi:RNA polymerase sigma-70 factor (ECF subfamily)
MYFRWPTGYDGATYAGDGLMGKRKAAVTVPAGLGDRARPAGRLLSASQERSLHERLVAGDERALMELINLTAPWLVGIAQRMLQDRDEAEDVVQEVFTIVWNRIELVDGNHGLVPWLVRVTRNRAIDRLRARRRREQYRMRAEGQEGKASLAAAEPDESALPGWHVHESVRAAIAALTSEQQDAVELAYFQGFTQSEVAERLGIPLGTVKTRLRLAFDRLRVALAPIKDWIS